MKNLEQQIELQKLRKILIKKYVSFLAEVFW